MKKILTQLGLVLGLSVATSLPVLLTSAPASAANDTGSATCGTNTGRQTTTAGSGDTLTITATGACKWFVNKQLVSGAASVQGYQDVGCQTGAGAPRFSDLTGDTDDEWWFDLADNVYCVVVSLGGTGTGDGSINVIGANSAGAFWRFTAFDGTNSGGGGGGGGSSSPSSSSSSPAKLVKVDLDPAGGTCLVDGRSTTAPTQVMAVGYLYVSGPSDCERPGYSLSGWADQSDPSTKLSLPLLNTDGQRRYFVADSLDLVAVWEPASFAVNLETLANFQCDDCDSVLLLWSVEPDLSGDVTVEIDGVVTQCGEEGSSNTTNWSYCWITGLTPGEHSATVSVESGTASARSSARSFAFS